MSAGSFFLTRPLPSLIYIYNIYIYIYDSPGTRTPRGHAAQARPRATSALFWARRGGGMITRGRPSTLPPPPYPPPYPSTGAHQPLLINGCSSIYIYIYIYFGCSSMAAHRSTASHQRPCSSAPCSSTPCSSTPCFSTHYSSTPCSSTAPTYSTILSSSVKVFLSSTATSP